MSSDLKRKILRTTARVRNAVRRRVPPGFRLPVGLLLISLGVFGFLPILGFWMIPLGIAVAALDVVPAWHYFQRRRQRRDEDRRKR